ncbi:helix-turn-helix domain-containing protein [Staphylococcus cohnii]|uniref:helix-turn-helix domain-containing protein n=1 Tax=Staphylococcus cohnii TaxID=29382 RepID=UPI003D7EF668
MAVEIRKMNARIAMVKKGVNAKQLSQKVPIDYIYLTKILNDKSKPSELMAIKIANTLDVDVSEIFNVKEA